MAIPFKPRWSEARIRTIYARQTRPSWDAEYLPGILATRDVYKRQPCDRYASAGHVATLRGDFQIAFGQSL